MKKLDLSKEAMNLYSELRDKGLSHSIALMAVIDFVIGSAAKVGASDDAVVGKGEETP